MAPQGEQKSAIPIFVISYNRGHYLERVIQSYRAQDIETEIVIHDNGSSDAATLEILSDLSADLRVYRYGPISTPEQLNGVDASVCRFRDETGYSGPYVVTDCDVDLSDAPPDALRTYMALLDAFPEVECVGPMLRISDIPKSYPLFNRVMLRHISQFWGRQPEWVQIDGKRLAYLEHRIDTTFAVHRAGSSFRRLKDGLRVYHPYEARHLDWYVSEDDLTNYRQTSSPAISHWDNEAEFAKHKALPPTVLNYTVVEGAIGALRAVERSTLDNPSELPPKRSAG
jgi:glycosyltransferase involved in cell wall biosynthesis